MLKYSSVCCNCVVTNCRSGYATCEKKPSFVFPEEKELHKKWIYFVNRKNWAATKYCMYGPLP